MITKLNCVLLVDDDVTTNFLNRKRIEKAEIADHIETALNGEEAINYLAAKEQSSCLILLDINMPIMDGWEFLQAYHNLEVHKKNRTVIVMLTTSFNPDDKIRAESIVEVSEFRYKPLTLDMINEIIKKYFSE